MAKHGWLLWTVLPLLLAAGVWWLTQRPADLTHPNMNFVGNERVSERLSRLPTRAELADLQNKADAACRCARAGTGNPCWADYRRSAARFGEPAWTGTACAEESVASECFGSLCVTTQRSYGACSNEEEAVRIAEARRRNNSGCGG